jgi:hypothetical protein
MVPHHESVGECDRDQDTRVEDFDSPRSPPPSPSTGSLCRLGKDGGVVKLKALHDQSRADEAEVHPPPTMTSWRNIGLWCDRILPIRIPTTPDSPDIGLPFPTVLAVRLRPINGHFRPIPTGMLHTPGAKKLTDRARLPAPRARSSPRWIDGSWTAFHRLAQRSLQARVFEERHLMAALSTSRRSPDVRRANARTSASTALTAGGRSSRVIIPSTPRTPITRRGTRIKDYWARALGNLCIGTSFRLPAGWGAVRGRLEAHRAAGATRPTAPALIHGVHLSPFSLAPPNPTANAPSRRRPSARRGCPPPRTSRCPPMARHGRARGSSRRDSQHAPARLSTR